MTELILHRGTAAVGPQAMRTGRDLVLEPGWADCLSLAPGTALDDHLAPEDRAAADAAARAALGRWRAANAAALTVDGLDLAHVCEVELLAGCFMPAERITRALPAALATLATTSIRLHGLDPGTAGLVRSAAHAAGVDCSPAAAAARPAAPSRRTIGAVALAALRRSGLPPRARGRIVCVPYWHLDAVYARLAAVGGALAPLPARVALTSLGPRRALAVAARGGWLGLPRARAVERAAHDLEQRIAALGAHDAVQQAALGVVRRHGAEALAACEQARAALRGGRARVLCLPWDSPDGARVLLHAMHEAGGTSLVVQHGFDAALGNPDKLAAHHAAVWSSRDAAELVAAGRAAASVTVTGNPGAAHLAVERGRAPGDGRAVVLLDYPSRLSARVDARISARHVRTALDGLAASGLRSEVVVRPHPADTGAAVYAALGSQLTGVRVTVDTSTPLEPLVAGAGLCIGAMSTATLQAAALGVPTVLLDVAGAARPWPFDGASGALPRVTDAGGLAAAAVAARRGAEVAGAGAAREALGARREAVDEVVALLARLSAGAG